MGPSVHGNFMTRLVSTQGMFRELDDLTTDHEKGGLDVHLVQIIVKLWAVFRGSVIIGKSPFTLGTLVEIVLSKTAGEGPVTVRVLAFLLRLWSF